MSSNLLAIFSFEFPSFILFFISFFLLTKSSASPRPPELQRMLIGKNNEARFFRKIEAKI